MYRRKKIITRNEQGKILTQKFEYEPAQEGDKITRWLFRKKRKERYRTSESIWEFRYFKDPYKYLRKLLEHRLAGIETQTAVQFDDNDYWTEIQDDIFEWLIAEPERAGHSKGYWQDLIDTVHIGLGLKESDSLYRWRIRIWKDYDQKHRKGWAWGYHQFIHKDFNAFRTLLRLTNQRRRVDEVVELSAQLVKGGPYHKIDEDFKILLEPESKWGRTREYWQENIDRARLAVTGKPLDVEKKPIVLDPYEKEPTSIEHITFGLADIPDDWEVELADSFVEALGKANQPWKYTDPPLKHGFNVYWDNRTGFFKRLWGYHRYHKRGKKVDTGAFITIPHIESDLRKGVIITDDNLEKAIIGFKKGGTAKPMKTRLPIHANRWWAQLFGFYYSSGSIHRRVRKGKYSEVLFRIRAHEDVVPMVMQAARAVGGNPILQGYIPVYKKGKATGLGTTVRPTILMPRGIFLVMRKMGLHLEFEKEDRRMVGRTSSSMIAPRIPDWIKNDEDCMHAFMEAFINGSKGQSQMGRSRQDSKIRSWLQLAVMLRMTGRPREDVERFMLDVKDWFDNHGVDNYFREHVRYDGVDTHTWKFEVSFVGASGWRWLLENFEIARPDLRARIYSRVEAIENPELYEALLSLDTPDSVLLGMLYEQPRTKKEISTSLQMKEVGVTKSLQSLQMRGLAERIGAHYYYEPRDFVERFVRDSRQKAEVLSRRMQRFSARLLNQCQVCRRVYINERNVCGMCGGEVEAVLRKDVLKRLDNERRYAKMLAYRLTTKDTEGLL